MTQLNRRELVLAIHPMSRGFAFALFESPLSPIDWGIKHIRGRQKNARSFEAVKRLLDHIQPDVLVLEQSSGAHGRRAHRINRLLRLVASYANGATVEVHTFSRATVRECFQRAGASTRYEIAQTIASQIAAFGHRLPPLRKLWMSEDVRMSLFDAASLVMTFYCRTESIPSDTAELDEFLEG